MLATVWSTTLHLENPRLNIHESSTGSPRPTTAPLSENRLQFLPGLIPSSHRFFGKTQEEEEEEEDSSSSYPPYCAEGGDCEFTWGWEENECEGSVWGQTVIAVWGSRTGVLLGWAVFMAVCAVGGGAIWRTPPGPNDRTRGLKCLQRQEVDILRPV